MQNFWELILVLSSLTAQHTVADVARLAGTRIELKFNDEYVRIYKSITPIQLQLNNNTVTAVVEVRDFKKDVGKPFYIGLYDLKGACLSCSMLKEHLTELSFPSLPSNPVPEAQFSQKAKFNEKPVRLGFKLRNPECLSEFSLNFD
jgi:hypothetical protein